MKLIEDILKTTDPNKSSGDKYSLSRMCLLTCLVFILAICVFSLFYHIDIKLVVDTLYNLIVLFSAYAFGSKAIKSYQDIKKVDSHSDQTP